MSLLSLMSESIKLANHGLTRLNKGTNKLNNHLIEINKKFEVEKPVREALDILDTELIHFQNSSFMHMLSDNDFQNIKSLFSLQIEVLKKVKTFFNMIIVEGDSNEITNVLLSLKPRETSVNLIKEINELAYSFETGEIFDTELRAILDKKPEIFNNKIQNYLYYLNRGDVGCIYSEISKLNIKMEMYNNLILDLNKKIGSKHQKIKVLEQIKIVRYTKS